MNPIAPHFPFARLRGAALLALLAGVAACAKTPSAAPMTVAPTIIGSRGTEPGKFSYPRGIDVATDGRIAVTDKTGRLQILKSDGSSLASWEMPKMDNGTPTGVIFDETDATQPPTILIADTHNSRILRYSLDGKLGNTFGEYGEAPGQMIYPCDIALDPKGNLYVSEYGRNDRVLKFDRAGKFIKQWGGLGTGPGQFQRPLGLLWLPPGKVVVADSCNHRIQTFSDEGEFQSVWGAPGPGVGQFDYPYDLCLAEDGLLYIAEYGNNRIQAFTTDGKPAGVYGRGGSAPGQFGTPWGIATDHRGRLYVADTQNHRLQILPLGAVRGRGLKGEGA